MPRFTACIRLSVCLLLLVELAASTNFDEGVIVSFDPASGKLVLVSYNHYAAEKKQATWGDATIKVGDMTVCSLDGDFVTPAIALRPGRQVFIFGKGRGKPAECIFVVSQEAAVWRGTISAVDGDQLQLAWKQKTDSRDFPITLTAGTTAPAVGSSVTIQEMRPQVVAALSPSSLPPAPTGDRAHTAWGVITGTTETGLRAEKFTKDGWQEIEVPLAEGKGSQLILDHRMSGNMKNAELRQKSVVPGRRFVGFCYRKRVWPSMFHLLSADDSLYGTVHSVADQTLTVETADGKSQTVTVAADARLTLDGEATELAKLTKGMRVRVFEARSQTIVGK